MMQITSQKSDQKKELKRIEWNIVKRLITLLYHNGNLKKTNIAMKSNMSYDKCMLYLNWLIMIDLIKKEKDDNGFDIISLKDRGEKIFHEQIKTSDSLS